MPLTEMSEARYRASVRRLSELDWDFPTQSSESAFSSLHWHPCRFPSQIPAIGRLSAPGDVILDPFMGSATTLVEAQRLGRRSVGIDINPISCLMAQAKTLPIPGTAVRCYVDRTHLALANGWENLEMAETPKSVQAAKWYMPATLASLRKIWGVVCADNSYPSVIGKAAFSSILLAACRETRHWGYVCDNTSPKSAREADAKSMFLSSLERFAAAYCERDSFQQAHCAEAMVSQGDARTELERFPENHFSCAITSPPYFGVTDYVKAQRLSMEWISAEIEPLRQQEIGARSKRHRKDAQLRYIAELKTVFKQTHRVLKPAGLAIVIFGQSPRRPDAHNDFVEALQGIGFSLELERRRYIRLMRRQMPSLADETVLVFRK